MPAYVLVQVDVKDPVVHEGYKKLTPPSIAWWNRPEYAPAKAIRQSAANTEMIVIPGI